MCTLILVTGSGHIYKILIRLEILFELLSRSGSRPPSHTGFSMQNQLKTEDLYEVFCDLTTLVHSTTDVGEVLDLVAWKLTEILGAKGTIIRVLNLEKDQLELGAAYGLSEDYLSKGPVCSTELIAKAYERNQAHIIRDIWHDPFLQYPQEAWEEGISMVLDLPITLRKNLVGLIRAFFTSEREFSQSDLDFLSTVSRQCAWAIERAHAFAEQKSRYDQLIIQNEKLSALGTMAAGIAHEINNPLFAILLYSSTLRKKVSEEEGPFKEGLDIIINETIRCKGIIQDLLSFSREREPKKVPTSLNPIIEKVLDLLQNSFDTQGIAVIKDLRPDIPDCPMDANQIQQVFLNLLLNALDAVRENGTIIIRSYLDTLNKCIVGEIEDSGCGIPEEVLPKIFDPFYSTKSKGTGLGLAVSHGIIQNHGGELKVFSKMGEGARFVVEIPLCSKGLLLSKGRSHAAA